MGKRVGVLLMGGWGEERKISLKTGERPYRGAGVSRPPGHRIFAGPGLTALRPPSWTWPSSRCTAAWARTVACRLLELLELPHTARACRASALAMNKPVAKKLFRLHNLPTPQGYRVGRDEAADALVAWRPGLPVR